MRDVVVVGSFADAMSLGFGLEIGVRGLIAHDAGVGRDGAGVSGLPRLSTWGPRRGSPWECEPQDVVGRGPRRRRRAEEQEA